LPCLSLSGYTFVLSVLPKSLFRRFPFRALATLGGLLDIVSTLLWPVLELGKQLGRLVLPARKHKRGRMFAAREELKQITTQSEKEGSLTTTERVMIHNVVDFTTVKACDVMVPLPKMVTIEPNTPVEKFCDSAPARKSIDCLSFQKKEKRSVSSTSPIFLFDQTQAPIDKYIRRIVTARRKSRRIVSFAITRRAARPRRGRQRTKKTDRHRDVGRIDQTTRFSRTRPCGRQRSSNPVVDSLLRSAWRNCACNSSLKNGPAADLCTCVSHRSDKIKIAVLTAFWLGSALRVQTKPSSHGPTPPISCRKVAGI